MPGGIYLIQDDERLLRMDQQDYDSEALLQKLLARYPDLLAGDQIDSAQPRRWLLVDREVGVPVGEEGGGSLALDHLFLDQDAVPTLVEVKRSPDTRLRREVVGQMLDYAANAAAYLSLDRLTTLFEQRCRGEEADPEDVLAEALGEELRYGEFWQQVETNLLARRMRLIFVADRIPPELRRVVEFLNQTMNQVEVLAVEIPQYAGEGLRALVPRVIGQVATRPTPRPKTNEAAFLATWEEPHRSRFVRLLELARKQGLFVKWGGKGFSLNVVLEGQNVSVLEGYPPDMSEGMFIPFSAIERKVRHPEAIVRRYRGELEQLPPVTPAPKSVRCKVSALDDEQEARLHEILRGVVGMIRERGLAGG